MYIRKYTDLHLFTAKYSHLQGFLRVRTIKKRENPQKTRIITIKNAKEKACISYYIYCYTLIPIYLWNS